MKDFRIKNTIFSFFVRAHLRISNLFCNFARHFGLLCTQVMKESAFTPEEEQMIQREFEALLDDYAHTPHRQKIELITHAFNFANKAHYGVRRLSGEPYILHPIAVARICER